MAALRGAVALEQVQRIAVRVGEDLHLDVAGAVEIAFDQHAVVAEGGSGFLARGGEGGGEVGGRVTTRMPAPAAAGDGLDDDGKADARGLIGQQRGVLRFAVVAGQHAARPLRRISVLAADFEPIARIADAGGPTKTTPAAAQASAKAGFSERKP